MLEAGLEPATLGYLIIIIRPTLYQLSYTSIWGTSPIYEVGFEPTNVLNQQNATTDWRHP
jgi:protoheme ferro-lyase